MGYFTSDESSWAKRKTYTTSGGFDILLERPTLKGALLGWGMKAAGAGMMMAIGSLLGEGLKRLPYTKQPLTDLVNYVSGMDFTGNLNGVGALAGGIYGFFRSGVHIDNNLEVKRYKITPVTIRPKKDGNFGFSVGAGGD